MNKFLEEIKRSKNPMNDTIVIDLDGTIVDFNNCPNRGICDYTPYPDSSKLKRKECKLDEYANPFLHLIKNMGIKIVILTARVESEREVTEWWLKHNDVPYDKLVMNKPRGFMYIDDLGANFHNNWNELYTEIKQHVTRKNNNKLTD